MVFACPNCQTQYNIAPEKFAGRVLRLRCRYCQHQIVVRDATGRHRQPTDVLRVAAALMEGEPPTGRYAGPPPGEPGSPEAAGLLPPRPLPQEPPPRPRRRHRTSEGIVVETSPNAARRIRVPTGLFAKVEGASGVQGPPPGDQRSSGSHRRQVTSPGTLGPLAAVARADAPGTRRSDTPANLLVGEATRREPIPEDLFGDDETRYESVPASMLEDLGPAEAIDFVDVDPQRMLAALGAPPPEYVAGYPDDGPPLPAPTPPAPKSALQALNHPALWAALGLLIGVLIMAALK